MEYYLIQLKGICSLLSIYEEKQLTEKEYHPIDNEELGEYRVLVPVTATIGNELSYILEGETYQDYQFQFAKFKEINDFSLDGFAYDKDNGIVLYGMVYGIYAEKKNDNCYYDVITGRKISFPIIGNVSKVETVDNFQNMIEDLELIGKHKKAYSQIVQRDIDRLEEGIANCVAARKRYEERYNAWKVGVTSMTTEQSIEGERKETIIYRNKVKEMIAEIKKA